MEDNSRKRSTTIWTVIFIIGGFLLYAYAFQATDVNLEEPLRPQRQENLIGLLREMARPDFFDYDEETRSTNVSIRMPCPEVRRASQITSEGRFVLFSPNCATTTQDVLTLTGEGFASNVRGVIRWYPPGSTTTRTLTPFRADAQGNFTISFTMPDIRETEEAQRIEVVEVVGRTLEGLSETTIVTYERIIETILMALMASTIGTLLSVPISFLAARNLMENVNMPLASISAALLMIPFGWFVGQQFGTVLINLSSQLTENMLVGTAVFIVVAAVLPFTIRLGPSLTGSGSSGSGGTIIQAAIIILALLLAFFGLGILAHLGIQAGQWLDPRLGPLGFLGNFGAVVSDLTRLLLPYTLAFTAALAAASLGGRLAKGLVLRFGPGSGRFVTFILTFLGVGILVFLIAYFFNWICFLGLCRQLPEAQSALLQTLAIPAVIGGSIAGLLSLLRDPEKPFSIGFVIYTLSRSTLNLLRAIEPLIIGSVFVVWVGIGPFAGIMALILNSVADLGKLFSEQVENIEEGPLEAITATGANRLQVIVFSVIPQITPHYIAFAFYRWDINVRLSTIIGFIGGGGIGLVLQRSANLTQYSQASVMIIAIAIVVTVLDYISSKLRSRII
jgi:phosphonate ABC transporter permease subunit PhnE